mgnify:CR=1 FL=1
MSENKRLNNYDELPLVLDVADIQRIMGISRVTAYELVHTPGFPAFRSGRLIKVSKIAFSNGWQRGMEGCQRIVTKSGAERRAKSFVQVKGGSHLPSELMRASTRTGYYLTQIHAGLQLRCLI